MKQAGRGALRTALLVVALGMAAAQAGAFPYPNRYFGHDIELLQKRGEDTRLTVDGKEMSHRTILSLDETAIVGGIGVVIGASSDGGNACDAQAFVIALPAGKPHRFDGPIGDCSEVKWTLGKDEIVFHTTALAGRDGKQWTWRPDAGFSAAAPVKFRADPSKGWDNLRGAKLDHPADLMGYGEIGAQIRQLLGPQEDEFLPILNGVGSGEFSGGAYVGTVCAPHQCGAVEALIVADVTGRKVYLAWKPEDRPIVVRPAVQEWPEVAKTSLRDWAKTWTQKK